MVFLSSKVLAAKLVMPAVAQSAHVKIQFQLAFTPQRPSKAIQSLEGSPPHFSRILRLSERKGSSRLCRVPLSTHQQGDPKSELVGGVSLYETSAAGELFNAVHFCLFIAYNSVQYHTMYCVYMTYSLSDVWSLLLPLVLLPLAICATTHLVRQFAWAEVDGYLQLRGTEEQRAHDGCFAAAGWVPNAVDHIHDRSSLARSRALNGYLIDLSSIPNQYNFTSICQQDSARSCLWKDASLWISIPVLDSTSVHRMLSDTIIMLWTAESLYTWAMTSNVDFGYPCDSMRLTHGRQSWRKRVSNCARLVS